MLKLTMVALRSWRLWPVVGLVVLAATGIVVHVAPSAAATQTTSVAAAGGAGGTGAVAPVVPGDTAAGLPGAPAAAAPAADTGPALSGVATSGTSAGGTPTSGGTNPKSRPMQQPATQAGVAAAQLPPPTAAIYAALPYHSPTATTAWTGTPDATVHALIVRYFPANQVANADRVSLCESGQRSVSSKPNSNGSRDHGIFQLNDGGTLQSLLGQLGQNRSDIALALNPDLNVRAAALLYSQRGWQPWTCAAKLGIVAGLWSAQPGPTAGN